MQFQGKITQIVLALVITCAYSGSSGEKWNFLSSCGVKWNNPQISGNANWGQRVFRGINSVNLDAKGRLAMPARYREQLLDVCAGRLIVTIDTNHRCLLLYPLPEWEKIEREIESLPSFEPMSQRVKHLLIGHANDLEMDSNGRILLPQELRAYAALEKRICLLGQGKKLEIWCQDAWSEQREKWLGESTQGGELPEKLRNLAL